MTEQLPAALEERLAAVEACADSRTDFDARSWLWIVLLGIVGPLALLLIGWFA